MRKDSFSPPGPRSPTGCSSSANGTCGRSLTSTRPITTGSALTAAASSARPGPATLSLTSPRSGSSAGPSSAASSTSTSGPHRNPDQDQWPSSGTPQDRRSQERERYGSMSIDEPHPHDNAATPGRSRRRLNSEGEILARAKRRLDAQLPDRIRAEHARSQEAG